MPAVRDRGGHYRKLDRADLEIVAVRIDACVVVADRKAARRFAFEIDACWLAKPQILRVFDHLLVAEDLAYALEVSVVGIGDGVVKLAPCLHVLDRAVGFVDNALVQACDARDELDRRARLDALSNGPILIDDRKHLAGLRLHNDDGAGVAPECVDGDPADREVFAFGVVGGNICYCLGAKAAFKGEFPLAGLACGGFAAAAFRKLRGTAFGLTLAALGRFAAAVSLGTFF
ncbi:MAG: hypothetical protein UZ17_ACD001001910 [Acidobacteria bacterium OLB17]|nr:MAG: hypothetical protein UZ17_ACD001001910 [Acidobacteria bacterium OLB17]